MPLTTGDNNFATAKWVVSATAGLGTHTTIASAITAASSGDTIVIKPGTYTENLTLKAGVTLASWGTGGVTIVGKATATAAGFHTLSNLTLQTNGDFVLEVSGSAATVVVINECALNATNASLISHSSSNAASVIACGLTQFNLTTTGITIFVSTSTGFLTFRRCVLNNLGLSTTPSTISAGSLIYYFCEIYCTTTTTSTSSIDCRYSLISTSNINTIGLTHGGSGVSYMTDTDLFTGSATAMTITGTLTCSNVSVNSSNATTIGGAGTIIYDQIHFYGTTSALSTTTQTIRNNIISTAKFGDGSSAAPSIAFQNNSNMGFYRGGPDTISLVFLATVFANLSGSGIFSVNTGQFALLYSAAADATPTYTFSGDSNTGMYRSAADTLRIVTAGAAGIAISSAGEVNLPLQPAFLATASAQTNNTGDGTVYTVVFDTEIFDQNGDFDGTSTFTAPVAGRYQVNATIGLSTIVAASNGNFAFVASNRTQYMAGCTMGTIRTSTNGYRMTGSMLIDMDAADTCTISTQISGGTKTVGIEATYSTFSVHLAC